MTDSFASATPTNSQLGAGRSLLCKSATDGVSSHFPAFISHLAASEAKSPFPSHEAAVAVAQTLKQCRGWSVLQDSVFEAGIEQKSDGCWGSKFAVSARNGVFQDTLQLAGLTEEIGLPTSLILPKQGFNRTSFQLKPYQQHLSNLTIIQIPGNHWPHLVEPQSFNQAVADFLGDQLKAGNCP